MWAIWVKFEQWCGKMGWLIFYLHAIPEVLRFACVSLLPSLTRSLFNLTGPKPTAVYHAEKFESIWPMRSSQIESPWRPNAGVRTGNKFGLQNWLNSFVRRKARNRFDWEIVFGESPWIFIRFIAAFGHFGQQDGFVGERIPADFCIFLKNTEPSALFLRTPHQVQWVWTKAVCVMRFWATLSLGWTRVFALFLYFSRKL